MRAFPDYNHRYAKPHGQSAAEIFAAANRIRETEQTENHIPHEPEPDFTEADHIRAKALGIKL